MSHGKYTFPCGCAYDILEPASEPGKMPLLDFDVEKAPKDCPAVWELLAKGLTKGIFQLESNLGRRWTKELRPESIEHMSALGAILRPGCISGDTHITISTRDRSGRRLDARRRSMRDLYKQVTTNHVHWTRSIVSVDEHELDLFRNVIEDVIFSGYKDVFRPRLMVGNRRVHSLYGMQFYDLDCTADHRLLTHDRGWQQLQHLIPGERVAVIRNSRVRRQGKHTLGEKSFRDFCREHYQYRCIFCDWHEGSLDVNHLEHNRRVNNDPENLCFMCPNHHRQYSEGKIQTEYAIQAREQHRLRNSRHIWWVEYAGRDWLGVKDTYDITVTGPHNNFIAGNVVVHNCLRAKDAEGLSTTDHYCRRKNKSEPVAPYHPVVDPILEPTYSQMIYQEQAMAIASAVAGFSPQEADMLRKAIGKKLPEEMAKVKTMFLEKAKEARIVSEEMAQQLFGWIQESQRYSFNRCAAGSEVIRRAGCSGRFPFPHKHGFTIAEMYHIRYDLEYAKRTGYEQLRRKWMRLGHFGKGLSLCDDGRIRPNTIEDIQPAGKRTVYKIALLTGQSVRVTDNHKFPTNIGELTVAQIYARRLNGELIRLFVCGEFEESDKDRTRSKVTDLEHLCSSCHKKADYKLGRTRRGEKGYPSQLVEIATIDQDGIEQTYDVTMGAPNHNFVLGSDIVTCNSHAYCYGMTGYEAAYIKAHFPVAFFAAWLDNSKLKKSGDGPLQEIYELVNDAKLFDIKVTTPDLRSRYAGFESDGKVIWFGLSNIKGIGEATVEKAVAAISVAEAAVGRPLEEWTWMDFLLHYSGTIASSLVDRFIKVGAVQWLGKGRMVGLEEFNAWKELTDSEQAWAQGLYDVGRGLRQVSDLAPEVKLPKSPAKPTDRTMATWNRKCQEKRTEHEQLLETIRSNSKFDTLPGALRALAQDPVAGGMPRLTDRRKSIIMSHVSTLEHPIKSVVDYPHMIAFHEEDLLGIPITFQKIDSCDQSDVNISCKEYIQGRREEPMFFGVTIEQVRETRTKSGKNPGQKMARVVVSDGTAAVEMVCFPDLWKDAHRVLTEGNTIILLAECMPRNDRFEESLAVKQVYQANQVE